MADLEIKIIGDGKGAQDTFKKLTDNVKEATGYIGKMEAEMKLLKAQMRSASESEIPAMRTQFLGLKNAIREAQYGSETFTKKIGGEFDAALQKANKNLFSLSNLAKGLTAGLGIGAIASQFIQATGAADALSETIKDVVTGLKNLNKTQLEIDLSRSTAPLLARAEAYFKGLRPQGDLLAEELNIEIAKLSDKLYGNRPQTIFEREQGLTAKPWTPEEIARMKEEIRLLDEARSSIIAFKNVDSIKTGGGRTGRVDNALISSPFGEALARSRTSSAYDAFVFNRRQAEINARREASRQEMIARHKEWEDEEKNRKDSERRIAQARIQYMDRAGARLANVFEDAVSAGMRGGFNDFLRNYMQQIGLKTFSGLLRLAFSSAAGGSFGVGGLLGHIFGFAGGGEFYTHGAMPIIVGDNPGGVEKVTVEPISGKGTTGLKNGHLALAGGGSVMSSPSFHNQGGGMGNIEVTLELDKVNLGKVLYMPNGVVDTINRMRANPV